MSLPAAVHRGHALLVQHPRRHQAADDPHHRHQAGRALRDRPGPVPRLPRPDVAGPAADDHPQPALRPARHPPRGGRREPQGPRAALRRARVREHRRARRRAPTSAASGTTAATSPRPQPGQRPPTARWDFAAVPAGLGDRAEVRCEYSFDIYRTTKGEEGRDVSCTFRFYTWRYRRATTWRSARSAARSASRDPRARRRAWPRSTATSRSTPSRSPTSAPSRSTLPGGLFRNAAGGRPRARADPEGAKEQKVPLTVRVICDSPTQYVGMAKYDFYLRLDDRRLRAGPVRLTSSRGRSGSGCGWPWSSAWRSSSAPTSTASSACSSRGVLYLGGLCRDFVESVALGKNAGGGPTEAMHAHRPAAS